MSLYEFQEFLGNGGARSEQGRVRKEERAKRGGRSDEEDEEIAASQILEFQGFPMISYDFL